MLDPPPRTTTGTAWRQARAMMRETSSVLAGPHNHGRIGAAKQAGILPVGETGGRIVTT